MLSSRAFQGSDRQRKFLSYVVEEALDGRSHLLKEYSIGIEVFRKNESFDPRIDTIVRVEARKLRSRIARYYEDEGKQDALRIEFVRGSYAPFFHEADDPGRPGTAPSELVDPRSAVVDSIPKKNRRKRIVALLSALVILICIATYLFYARHQREAGNGLPSIAVLPFANLGDEKNEFFSDGLTDELIDSLGRVPGLHVVGRTSAFQLKGKTLDLREIGRSLNVRTVLEGSVRQSNGRLRITAELDDTSNGYRLWSQSYDRDMKDILAIQREISRAITGTLGRALSNSGAPTRLAAAFSQDTSINSEAYQDYLRGRYFWNRSTASNVNTAIGFFERSIAEDPQYALAYVGLAACYISIPRHSVSTTRDLAPKIRAAAAKALMLDETLGEAHLDLGQALASEFNWKAAQTEYLRGLELSPGNAVGHRWYSTFLARIGRLDDSLAEARKALELDPVSLMASETVGEALFNLRRYDEAIEQFRKTLAMDPTYGFAKLGLGRTYLQKRMYREGLTEIEMGRQLLEGDLKATSTLGYAYAVSGETAASRKILADFLAQSRHGRFKSVLIADIYLGLGDKDGALEWLGKSIDEGDSPYLNEDPAYDSLRSDPRFAKLLNRMKLQ
jgi:TolB-like protein